jgi:hypothetical protein
MCKSFIKITVLIFLILYTFEVNAIENEFNKINKGNDTFTEVVEIATPKRNVNTTEFGLNNETNTDDQPEKKVEADMDDINSIIKASKENKKDNDDKNEYKEEEENPIVPASRTTRTTHTTPKETKTTTISKSEKTPEETNVTITTLIIAEPTAEPTAMPDDVDDNYKSDNSNNGVASVSQGRNDNPYNVQNNDNNNISTSNEESSNVMNLLKRFGSIIIAVGAVSVGLVAVSGYKVLKRKSETKTLKSTELYSASTPPSLMRASDYNNPRLSLVNSLVSEAEQEGNMLYYSAKSRYNESEIQPTGITIEPNNNNEMPSLPCRLSLQSDGSTSDKSVTVISVNRNSIISRNSVIRHSFLNPNLNIIRTGKRTQQLFEATSDHPAIIETFPSLERPFVPAIPVPLEESDVNSLHPLSYTQMYQDDMEYESYYAYTIDDKEYIIDPTTNRVLEIHDLNTDEFMLVEEELYLDFSGSSDDSDSDKQTI